MNLIKHYCFTLYEQDFISCSLKFADEYNNFKLIDVFNFIDKLSTSIGITTSFKPVIIIDGQTIKIPAIKSLLLADSKNMLLLLHKKGIEIFTNNSSVHTADINKIQLILASMEIEHIDKEQQRFYSSYGSPILEEENYPSDIKEYLDSERSHVLKLLRKGHYEAILEVGCGQARNLDLAKEANVDYYGIDFVESNIIAAKRKINHYISSKSAVVECMSINDLNYNKLSIPKNSKVMCFFPFNAFGNVADIFITLNNLIGLNYDIYISTYKTENFATKVRERYFLNCGYKNITVVEDSRGVTFTSTEGLQYTAYSKDFILNLLKGSGCFMEAYDFCGIGSSFYIVTNKRMENNISFFNAQNREFQQRDIESMEIANPSIPIFSKL